MKTTLFLTTLAAGVLAVSTVTFAQQGFGNYAQAAGDAAASQRTAAPVDRFTRSDFGYQRKVTVPHSKARSSQTPIVGEPAPAQQED
jgi:hypothetical protein